MSWFSKLMGRKPVAPAPQPEVEPIVREEAQPDARYEGSYQYFGDRSLLPATLQDAQYDANPGVRMELSRRARYWERNSAIVNRLADLFEQFTVGATGLRIIPNSSGSVDHDVEPSDAATDWNNRASRYWDDWCKSPELDTDRSMAETQSLCARLFFIDGEIFVYKTSVGRTPKIQLIESHRVATPGNITGPVKGVRIQDGVELDANGKPVAYWVRKAGETTALTSYGFLSMYPYLGNATEEFERIPAENMLHLFESPRPGMVRGLTFLYPVLNDLHDLEDLQMQEMKAAKAAADLANIYITKTGEPKNNASFRRVNRTIQTTDASGNVVTKAAPLHYDTTQSGRDKYLKPGEDVKQFASDRPSVATREFWDYITFKVCAGAGISRLLVAPYAPVQGTVVRADLDVNSRFFLSRSGIQQRLWVKIYLWVMGEAVDFERELQGAPEDFGRVIVRPPRSVNVDIGRNSQAAINELEGGLRTYADWYSESGEDWKEQLEQRAREAAFINKMAAKYKVPREQIVATKSPAPPTAPGQNKDEPAKPNGKLNGFHHNRLELV